MIDDAVALRRALLVLFWGLLLTFLDLRIQRVDLIPDVVGWVLVGVSLVRARALVDDDTCRGLLVAAGASTVVPFTVSVAELAVDVGGPAGWAAGVCTLAVLVLAAFALHRVARLAGADHLRSHWVACAWLLAAAAVLVGLAVASDDDAVAVVGVVLSVATFAVYLLAVLRTRAALPAG